VGGYYEKAIAGSWLWGEGEDLNSIEVQLAPAAAGGNAGGCTAAHADPVGWPADLDNEHANVWILLF